VEHVEAMDKYREELALVRGVSLLGGCRAEGLERLLDILLDSTQTAASNGVLLKGVRSGPVPPCLDFESGVLQSLSVGNCGIDSKSKSMSGGSPQPLSRFLAVQPSRSR